MTVYQTIDNLASLWEKKEQQSLNGKEADIMTIMNLVRESKIHGIKKEEVWKTLLKHRWDIGILKTSRCLNRSQVEEVVLKTSKDLKLKYYLDLWIPEEDLAFGTELYSILQCPRQLVEAARLSALFGSLLTNQNLNTVVASTMENIQPRAGDNIKDFTAINMWYERLDERYNFSLGSNILPLMTTDNLRQLETLDPPYLQQHKGVINEHKMSELFGKI